MLALDGHLEPRSLFSGPVFRCATGALAQTSAAEWAQRVCGGRRPLGARLRALQLHWDVASLAGPEGVREGSRSTPQRGAAPPSSARSPLPSTTLLPPPCHPGGKEGPADELPITPFRVQILTAVKNNRVTIIAGETGCGAPPPPPLWPMPPPGDIPAFPPSTLPPLPACTLSHTLVALACATVMTMRRPFRATHQPIAQPFFCCLPTYLQRIRPGKTGRTEYGCPKFRRSGDG